MSIKFLVQQHIPSVVPQVGSQVLRFWERRMYTYLNIAFVG